MGVTEIFYSLRFFVEGNTNQEIPESSRLKFLKKFLESDFADRRHRLQAVNRGGIIFVVNTIGNLPKIPIATSLRSDGTFCFISICKFGSFKSPFALITSLSELNSRFRRFSLFLQTKSVISVN